MSMALPASCDCLVIGGGGVGLSIAYELSGRGQSVCVVDCQTPGLEASWAGGGIFPPGSWYDDHPACEAISHLSWTLHEKWSAQLLAETGIDYEYSVVGAHYLATNAAHLQQLEKKFARWTELGIESHRLTPGELFRREPQMADAWATQADQLGAYYVPGEAQVRNPRLMKALLAGCTQRGVAVVYPAKVESIEPQGGRVVATVSSAGASVAGRCEAKNLVIAAGAWSSEVAKLARLSIAVKPVRGQMVLFAPKLPADPKLPAEMPVALQGNLHFGGCYAVPRRDGRVVVGTTVEEVGFDKSTTPEAIDSLVAWGRSLSPRLAEATVGKTWAGLRPASSDGLPYLGRASGWQNAYIATGHYRSGIQFATGTAVVIADLVEGKTPPLDLEPFRPDR